MNVPVSGDAPCAGRAIHKTPDAESIPRPSCSLRPPSTIDSDRKKPDLLLTQSHAGFHRNLDFRLVCLFVIPDSRVLTFSQARTSGRTTG